ncbi:MAG: DNA translocase FtsK [Bacilli bacterium]|jgi:DNA segregation ATPase FtsK/SpoIIIE-like protein
MLMEPNFNKKGFGFKFPDLASKKARYFAFGLLAFLLCLIGIFDRVGLGKIISFILVYLFGCFYFVPLAIGCFYGAYYFIRQRKMELDINGYLTAFCFAVFFCLIWASESDATIMNVFSVYGTRFSNIDGPSVQTLIDSKVGGGLIGHFFYSAIANIVTAPLVKIVYLAGFIIALLLLFRPLMEYLVSKIYRKAKSKKVKIKEIKEMPAKRVEMTRSERPEDFATERELKREEEILSRIKVVDTSVPESSSNKYIPQPLDNDFFSNINVIDEESNFIMPGAKSEKRKIFNVFTDSLTDFPTEEPESFSVRSEAKGFNVFRDALFDENTPPPLQPSIAQPPKGESVYDISDQDLLDNRKEEINDDDNLDYSSRNINERKNVQINPLREKPDLDLDMFRTAEKQVKEESLNFAIEEPKVQETPVMEQPKVEETKRVRRAYRLPPISLLNEISYADLSENKTEAELKIVLLNAKFNSLGIKAKVHDYKIAPAFTRFEVEVSSDVKITVFASVKNDLMMALSATHIDILTPIPGTNYVGIDIPNRNRAMVSFKEVFIGIPFDKKDNKLIFAVGKDIIGRAITTPINRAPHILVAGATGTGKSVCLNTIIISLLMRATPDEVKIMLIDPKRVEFSSYSNIPHLLCPVITDAKKAAVALDKLCTEMDNRFTLFSEAGKKNITFYNNYVKSIGKEPLPYIIVIIDELGDLMTVAKNEVEESIRRITQLARASGIHLIVATQRPSVDVITGVIKGNIPTRIAFAVSAYQDSRTILDDGGAENLLGMGDMLLRMAGSLEIQRIQGAFVSDEEVDRITDYCREQRNPEFDPEFLNLDPPEPTQMSFEEMDFGGDGNEDELYLKILQWLPSQETISASYLVRKFSIGHPRAARLLDKLTEEGYISEPNGPKPRTVFRERFLSFDNEEDDF